MPMDEKARPTQAHRLNLDERARLTVTAVEEVMSFDEQELRLRTALGPLLVRGRALKVEKLDKNSGELAVSGEVAELVYLQSGGKGGLWTRLLGQ